MCDDLPAEIFPGCALGQTLEGHAVTGADGKIGILSAEDYAARLAEPARSRSPASTCGPEDPDRRLYHLAFWTADGAEGGPLELGRREGEWSIGIVYADRLANWKTAYSDPEIEPLPAATSRPGAD